jgi:hypothetical protein
MTRIDGWAHTRWGTGGMLRTEAGLGVAGLAAFLGLLAAMNLRARSAA